MKKIILASLAIVLVISFIGCSKNPTGPEIEPTPTPIPTAIVTSTPVSEVTAIATSTKVISTPVPTAETIATPVNTATHTYTPTITNTPTSTKTATMPPTPTATTTYREIRYNVSGHSYREYKGLTVTIVYFNGYEKITEKIITPAYEDLAFQKAVKIPNDKNYYLKVSGDISNGPTGDLGASVVKIVYTPEWGCGYSYMDGAQTYDLINTTLELTGPVIQ